MPYFELKDEDIEFPPAYFADTEGLVAVGGAFSATQYLKALQSGLYLWHNPLKRPHWWSPDPRMVVRPELFSSDTPDTQNSYTLRLCLDSALGFLKERYNKEGWQPASITGRMERTYWELHELGYLQAWVLQQEQALLAVVLGVLSGNIFFTEYGSATHDAHGAYLWKMLIKKWRKEDVQLIDVQKPTAETFGFIPDEISRLEYLSLCKKLSDSK